MKRVWLVLIMLLPVLILIGPGCKKSQDEEKVKVKAVEQAVRKGNYGEVRDTVKAMRMEDGEMPREATAGMRK